MVSRAADIDGTHESCCSFFSSNKTKKVQKVRTHKREALKYMLSSYRIAGI